MTVVLLLVLVGVVMVRTIGTDSNRSTVTALNPAGSHTKRNVTVGPIKFQTIPGEGLAVARAGVVEVNDPQTWAAVWNNDSIRVCPINLPCLGAQPVNFTAETILVVSAGLKGSGGYEFNVTHITGTDDNVVVEATLTTPGQNCFVTLALTYPGQIVEIAKTDVPATLNLTTAQGPACPI